MEIWPEVRFGEDRWMGQIFVAIPAVICCFSLSFCMSASLSVRLPVILSPEARHLIRPILYFLLMKLTIDQTLNIDTPVQIIYIHLSYIEQ